MKNKKAKTCSFLNILRAIGAGRCRERRYADHTFIQIYFRMHHFVVKFSKFSSPQAVRGHQPPNQNPADPSGHPAGGQKLLQKGGGVMNCSTGSSTPYPSHPETDTTYAYVSPLLRCSVVQPLSCRVQYFPRKSQIESELVLDLAEVLVRLETVGQRYVT